MTNIRIGQILIKRTVRIFIQKCRELFAVFIQAGDAFIARLSIKHL